MYNIKYELLEDIVWSFSLTNVYLASSPKIHFLRQFNYLLQQATSGMEHNSDSLASL